MMFLSGLLLGLFVSEFANVFYRNKKWSIWSIDDFDKNQYIEKEKFLLYKSENKHN